MPPTSLIVWGGSSEVVPKFTPHRPRIGWKTIPNGPECSRHPPRRVSKWFRDHFGAQIDAFTFLKQKKEGLSHWIVRFFAHFRQPAGTRKSTKIAPVPKKESPKTVPEAIFVPALFFWAFSIHFKPTLDRRLRKVFKCFCGSACAFSKPAKAKFYAQARCFKQFSISICFRFLVKKRSNNWVKHVCRRHG